MRRTALISALTLGICIAGAARAEDTAVATAEAVRAADIAFNKRTQEVGVAKAFGETMDATESLQFGGGAPNRGADAISKAMSDQTPPNTKLEWVPTDAWGSKSGDMGVTTGTWTFSGPPPTPTIKGRYVTVWRKNPAGVWKGLIDIGNPDPK